LEEIAYSGEFGILEVDVVTFRPHKYDERNYVQPEICSVQRPKLVIAKIPTEYE